MSEYHPLKGTMTATELMAYLDISVDTLRKLRADGLPTFKSGRVGQAPQGKQDGAAMNDSPPIKQQIPKITLALLFGDVQYISCQGNEALTHKEIES